MGFDFPSIDAARGRHESYIGLKPHHFYTGGSYLLPSAHGRHEQRSRSVALAMEDFVFDMTHDPLAAYAEFKAAIDDAVMAEFLAGEGRRR